MCLAQLTLLNACCMKKSVKEIMALTLFNATVIQQIKNWGLPLARAPESQITAEQSSTGRHWNTPKKIPHIKREGKRQWDGRRGAITIKSNPITAVWVTHKLENNYTTEVPPLEWRFWAPHQASQPRGPAMGGGIPRESDFEAYWDLIAGLQQNWRKQRLHKI